MRLRCQSYAVSQFRSLGAAGRLHTRPSIFDTVCEEELASARDLQLQG